MKRGFIFRGESEDLDETARATAGGSFVQLSQGCTHYELGGPNSGRAVVLVHGFSVPYFIWDPTFGVLISAGRRTLRYDLYGRGYSDRPHLTYDMDLFVRQLYELLERLEIQSADVVGLSMGGAIASAFTVRFPGRVRRPSADRSYRNPSYEEQLALHGSRYTRIRRAGSRTRRQRPDDPQRGLGLLRRAADRRMIQSRYGDQMRYRGFKRAILSTLRHKMVDGFPEVYAQLGKSNTPVLLLWGEDDKTIPLEQSRSIIDLVPQAELHVIPGCGHIPHYEKPETVNPLLLGFLS